MLRSQDTPKYSEMIAKVDPAQSAEQSKSEPYFEHLFCQFVRNKNVLELMNRFVGVEPQQAKKQNQNIHHCTMGPL